MKYFLETEDKNCPMLGFNIQSEGLGKRIPADLPKNLREVSLVRRGERFGLP